MFEPTPDVLLHLRRAIQGRHDADHAIDAIERLMGREEDEGGIFSEFIDEIVSRLPRAEADYSDGDLTDAWHRYMSQEGVRKRRDIMKLQRSRKGQPTEALPTDWEIGILRRLA